jgi:uroporphyrinogen decarboxylase
MRDCRQVIDALLHRKPAARVGLNDGPWGDTVAKWVKQGMPADEKGNSVDVVDHFGFDMAGCGGWFDWQPLRGVAEVIEETEEWKVVRNGSGAALKWWKNKSGTPEHIDFRMTSRAVWDRDYRPHLMELDRQRLHDIKGQAEGLARRKQQGLWTFFGNQFIWENMRASMGDYVMYMSLVEDPGWVHDFNRVYTDVYKTYFRILLEEVGLPDGIWIYEDLGYRGSLFCSPRTLEELIFPYYAELVAFFHSYGLPVVFHTCGYTEPALELIVAAGFDALNPMENKAGNDPLRIADKYADKLAFVGGLDARILESGDRGRIRRGVGDLIDGMKDRGASYVYGSDHSISTLVDYEAFLFSLEVYREHMAY